MKKYLLAVAVCLSLWNAQGQVIGGDLLADQRQLAEDFKFDLYDNEAGVIVFRVAVNREGIVTGAQLVDDKSTIVSTPVYIRAKDYVLKMKFVPATYFPKFHHGEVQITIKNGN